MRILRKTLFIVTVFSLLALICVNFCLKEREKLEIRKAGCEKVQKPLDVMIDNVIWQVLETPEGRVNLLNAYLDERFNMQVVRINANGPSAEHFYQKILCQFWFDDENEKPIIVRVSSFQTLWLSTFNRK